MIQELKIAKLRYSFPKPQAHLYMDQRQVRNALEVKELMPGLQVMDNIDSLALWTQDSHRRVLVVLLAAVWRAELRQMLSSGQHV